MKQPKHDSVGGSSPVRLQVRSFPVSLLAFACLLPIGFGTGCGSGGGLSGGGAVEPLPEFDGGGNYTPYYATGEMNIPRYLHEVTLLSNSLVLVLGGSDENGLTAIDTGELFDQTTLKQDETAPESGTGTYFDTDFEGNPIAMQVPRLYFTLNELPDNRVMVIGGVSNLGLARPTETAEIFDPLTRTFEDVDEPLLNPRFRHTTSILPNGQLMVIGGQIHSTFTEEEEQNVQGGVQGGGQVIVQMQQDTFPSIKVNEVFSLAENLFRELTILDSEARAELTTRRGRSGHEVARFAGPDNRLKSGDDLYLLVGGFQTLSGENAPLAKTPGLTSAMGGQTGLTSLEFYDPVIGTFTKVPALSLLGIRINDPQVTNLGVFSERTPDGLLGMGNVLLVCNGDDDNQLRATRVFDEVLIASFTGFGPAQGLQVFRQDSPNGGHIQSTEGAVTTNNLIPPNFPIDYEFGNAGETEGPPGRTGTTIAPALRRLEDGSIETAVYNLGGIALAHTNIQFTFTGGSIAAGVFFDPFFSLEAALDFELSPRDLTSGRLDPRNPFGVVGCWLLLDGEIPSTDLTFFGSTPPFDWAELAVAHIYGKLATVPGPDGIKFTEDDRILVIGGGINAFLPGGDPSSPSSEILIQPGQGASQ